MRVIVTLAFYLLCYTSIAINDVPVEVARQTAINFYLAHLPARHLVDAKEIEVSETIVKLADNQPVYYIFNLEPKGFIIISATYATIPVIAYSFEGNYSEQLAPPQCKAWMKQFESQLLEVKMGNVPVAVHAMVAWEAYSKTDGSVSETAQGVAPLLTSNWNQNAPYNGQCPPDPAGPGGHTYAGCVPVAMGQLMYYYRWPQTGTGSYTYIDSIYGTISADFGATTYLWNNMPNSISAPNDGIAKLLFHLGVSCDLVYGPDGSGMYNHKSAYALRTHFKYCQQTQYIYRDSTDLNWDSIMIAHLERKMPMYYAGWSDPWTDGHAFVCDGYQDTCYFHFNFGWSGQNNGYYYTDHLIPGGSNFNLAQELIINAFPDTVAYTYPGIPIPNDTLRYMTGSLEDGSGPMDNYAPGDERSWLIDPQPENDSVSSITLTFSKFSTQPEDFIKIYDGSGTDAPLIGSYSGEALPAEITGTSNKMFIKFSAVSTLGAPGFLATYKTTIPSWCKGTQTIVADTAVVSDGSFDFDYHNSSVCRWILKRTGAGPLTIYFNRFETEQGKDFLKIYDMGTSDSLISLSGNYSAGNLPDSVTSPSGKMLLIFMTNATITGKGWEFYYPKSHVGIDYLPPSGDFTMYPNPASAETTIKVKLTEPEWTKIQVRSLGGNILYEGLFHGVAGDNSYLLDLTGWSSGFYLLQLTNSAFSTVKKLIIR